MIASSKNVKFALKRLILIVSGFTYMRHKFYSS